MADSDDYDPELIRIEDIYPASEFARKTREFTEVVVQTGRPIVLTSAGRPAMVVMSMEAFKLIATSTKSRTRSTLRPSNDHSR
jgi:prevent-host-death family protein